MTATRKFMVPVVATATVRDVIEVDVPLEFMGLLDATDEECAKVASEYLQNLLDDDGITLNWKIDRLHPATIKAAAAIDPVYRCACSWVGGDPDERNGKHTCPACWHHDRRRVEVKAGES
jgi:hypothetical protein